MIDILDGRVIARRIGGHVVLQGNGDIDQFARHGISSLLFLRLALAAVAAVPPDPSGGLNCRSFAENPSDGQPIARSRVLTSEPCPAIRRPGSGFHEDFIFPPGAFYSKRSNLHRTLLILLNTPFA